MALTDEQRAALLTQRSALIQNFRTMQQTLNLGLEVIYASERGQATFSDGFNASVMQDGLGEIRANLQTAIDAIDASGFYTTPPAASSSSAKASSSSASS